MSGRLFKVLVVAMLLVVAGLSAAFLLATRAVTRANELRRRADQDLVAVARLRTAFEHRVATARGYLLSGTAELRRREEGARGEFVRRLQSLDSTEEDPAALRILREIRLAEELHNRALVRSMDERQSGRPFEEAFEAVVRPRRRSVFSLLQSFAAQRQAAAEQEARRISVSLARVTWIMWAIAGTSLLATSALALVLARFAARERNAVQRWTEFLSIASHDVKTPLAVLASQVEILELRLGGEVELPPAVKDTLAKMRRQVALMGTLVNSVLDVSRIRLSSVPLDVVELDLAELTRSSVERLRPMFEHETTPLQLSVPGPVWGRWDRLRLEQVVANLLSNALKYGERKPVVVSVDERDDVARVSVRDHGVGIAKHDQSSIFERFSRVPSQRGPGHGLGLWICQGIVRAHGGRLSVQSSPGEGATFVLELPKRPAAA